MDTLVLVVQLTLQFEAQEIGVVAYYIFYSSPPVKTILLYY